MSEPNQRKILDKRLREVWRHDQKLHRLVGFLALFGWVFSLFLVGVVVDWVFDLPAEGRVVILAGLGGVAVFKAWQFGWRNLHKYDASYTALRVEKEHGAMESLLVTAVQFGESGSSTSGSDSLREKTCLMAEEAAEPISAKEAVSFTGFRRFVFFALIPIIIIGGFSAYNGPFLAAGLGRIFTPWLAFEYPTRTQIEIAKSDWIVKEGEGLQLVAKISGEIPDKAKIILRTGKGKPREREIAVVDEVCEYGAETIFRSFDYRIVAGDAKSDWHTVQVISTPRIERAEVTLEFPEYTQRPNETVEALTLTIPEGTKIRWNLTLDRAVGNAEFRPAEGDAIPLQIGGNGRSVTMQQVANGSRGYSFGWEDKEHGFKFSSPRHYLQVAPDRGPGIDITSPAGNLFATLERGIDFAFRGRDDHGIGEASIFYRVNKTGEERVALPTPKVSDGSEQKVDWDYRMALPELAVGDTVSFTIELADRYPKPDGPHRVRSGSRRVQFLSKEDYLAQIEKQKRRILNQIRTIYREERGVHDVIRSLDPSSDVFVQSCQVEAVRQDLMRDRLGAIRARIDGVVEDLIANKVSEEAESAALLKIGADLKRIADEHVGQAASLFRKLAAVDEEEGKSPSAAIDKVNGSARELGLVVLQLGFAEASDVMARELHATAQTQASLRLQTITSKDADLGDLEKGQIELAKATARLLAATPSNKESSSVDALIAFNLSHLVNGLVRSGADAKMRKAVALFLKAESKKAASEQARVISSLLQAGFRLRRGAEYEALTIARDIFSAQAAEHKILREEAVALTIQEFVERKATIATRQARLQRQVQLLLMPEVPAHRPRLFDAMTPPAPPVDRLLSSAESAMAAALVGIKAGDRELSVVHQEGAEAAFTKLAELTSKRMNAMTQQDEMKASVKSFGKHATQLFMLEERLLVLLEQVEDAADDEVNTAALATLNQSLSKDAEGFQRTIALWKESQGAPSEEYIPLLDSLARIVRFVTAATPLLKENKPDAVIEVQERALDAIEEANLLIEEVKATRTSFAGVLGATASALAPSPLLSEIEDEQARLTEITKKAKKADYPGLVIPQKNLIHTVNAVLTSLDPLAHKIETGTVMLFAKEDMDAAAIGLEDDDIEETLDAQSFVLESLQGLRAKIDKVTPEYRYIREVAEFIYEVVPQSALIRNEMQQSLDPGEDAHDAEVLKKKAQLFGSDLYKLTGEKRYKDTVNSLVDVIAPRGSDSGVEEALDSLAGDTEEMQLLMKNLAYLITPPPIGAFIEEPSDEVKMLNAALSVAAHHKDLFRKTQAAEPAQLGSLAALQLKLAEQCKALFPPPPPPAPVVAVEPVEVPVTEEVIEVPEDACPFDVAESESDIEPEAVPEPLVAEVVPAPILPAPEPHPNIGKAHRHLAEAAAKLEAGDRAAAITSQNEAVDALRYFILEYALKYVDVPPPAPAEPGPPSDDAEPDDSELQIFLPGSLTGERPKGGRLEWEVLGRRDRAALNENFARELPLEYRAILKDYYERLTK
ncbi:hypothetical protein N9Z10_04210 [Akkermansiaceae bacterium]|nr:hypothetical protein [Akkermansiaceae bacterium]MDB4407930.1 hypothetical protein [Akkermansiaceae bacterium]MDB4531795.1 hypothetical protein [Akkermansiaceae bacterium]